MEQINTYGVQLYIHIHIQRLIYVVGTFRAYCVSRYVCLHANKSCYYLIIKSYNEKPSLNFTTRSMSLHF